MFALTPAELEIIRLSLKIAFWSTLASLPVALALALLLGRRDFPGKTLVDGLVHLPLVLPPVVIGYFLLLAFGRRGPVGAFLEEQFGLVFAFRWTGAALACALMGLPLAVRAIRQSVEAVDRRLEAAATTLGANRFWVFLTVTLPLILPGIVNGALLSFARGLGEFGATITFVSNIPGETQTIPLAIYGYTQVPGGDAQALRLCAIAIVLAAAPDRLGTAAAFGAQAACRMKIETDIALRAGAFTLEARFESEAGVTVLFGRSGSGKTTLLNAIAGLVRPDRGRIAVGGEIFFDSAARTWLPPEKRRIGYVFQEGRLLPHLSVRHNLLYGRWFTPPAERYVELDRVVHLLDLDKLLERRAHGLSGGEKQRVAIGRALLASPRLLLMDEPLASLDAARKGEILHYIERLRDEVGIPIVYVSHAIEEVTRLADTLVLISDGRVTGVGPAGELAARWTCVRSSVATKAAR
ncbi:MAG: molybdate ABC transporter permease subunit [Betaproteobacteria bacterium]|nr:molybdate ABC transporter permease subunit [Betaproteobacteria bacterium]